MRLFLLLACLSVGSWAKSVRDLNHDQLLDELAHGRHAFPATSAQRQTTGVDWMARGQQELNDSLATIFNNNTAKNVILFIGDGMGVATLTAGRIFQIHRAGKNVTDGQLSWEDFPHTALVKTYNTNQQTPDSAGTATAFTTGFKSFAGAIAVDETVSPGNCSTMNSGNQLRSFIHYGQDENKAAGIVSTARVTHATPACAFAHSPTRSWEDNDYADIGTCTDIAYQLIHEIDNQQLRVVLGGGRQKFMPNTMTDPEDGSNGHRTDARNLIQEWKDIKNAEGYREGTDYAYVEEMDGFNAVDTANMQYLFGLFEASHMKYEADRAVESGPWLEPSLSQMVEKSIQMLERSTNGYVLLVEGGRIDHAHHETNANRALHDVEALHDAVQMAKDMTSETDTLIVVTADHSHVLAMSGYQPLDENILGKSNILADDNKPYTTLGYTNGPGYVDHRQYNSTTDTLRKDISADDTTTVDYLQDAHINIWSETHGGEDVVVYARGPMAHLFAGQHEQHYVAHAMMYAACIGPNKEHCA